MCCSKLAADFLCHPVKVTIGSQDLAASHSVTQVCGHIVTMGSWLGFSVCVAMFFHVNQRHG